MPSFLDNEGTPFGAGANEPFLVDDPTKVWLVDSGKVDVFAVAAADGEPKGMRTHVLSVAAGEVLFGISEERSSALLASGRVGTRVRAFSLARLREIANDGKKEEVAELLEAWVTNATRGVLKLLPPKRIRDDLEAGKEVRFAAGEDFQPRQGVVWVRHEDGESLFAGRTLLPCLELEHFFPHARGAWLHPLGDVRVRGVSTLEWMEEDPEWLALWWFAELIVREIALNHVETVGREERRLQRKAEADQRQFLGALTRMASVMEDEKPPPGVDDQDPLLAACQAVGSAAGITIRAHASSQRDTIQRDPLGDIARASQIRMRTVRLPDGWWRRDGGPLLAFREADRAPVALLPVSPRKYELWDPAARTETVVDQETALELDPDAQKFYRPLPARSLNGLDLLKSGLQECRRDLLVLATVGLLAGLVGLLTPYLTGVLFDTVIPGAETGQLFHICLALFVSAVSIALFELTRSISLLRAQGKLDGHLQSAVWDRLINLPIPFYHRYTAGDLAKRGLGIMQIQRLLSGAVINTVLASVFSTVNLGMLFYYDWQLALVAIGIVAVTIGVTIALAVRQVRWQRKLADVEGKIAGMVLQFVTGIAKLRTAGAEARTFSHWAERYVSRREFSLHIGTLQNVLETVNSGLPIAASMIIFSSLIWVCTETEMTTGDFLAFNSAFAQFLAAAIALTPVFMPLANAIPLYERAKPLLEAVPEFDESKIDPGEFTGRVEVGHLSFRYAGDGPLVLSDVTLTIEPGELVALVGPSGSGKSTLFRLMLGFEEPEAGSIYYDGQELSSLDIRSVRQQIGVVLQNAQVMQGDILRNIVGSSMLTIDDAWEAARMAGLEDDIKAMPMGMHTVISQGGGTFSGGQRQRLLIARALVTRPRVIFFDEATSALDNRTQEIVSQSLDSLQATRIVIAHRLSTIMHADRIFVLVNGRLEQSGTYDELVSKPGMFADLAKRQMA